MAPTRMVLRRGERGGELREEGELGGGDGDVERR